MVRESARNFSKVTKTMIVRKMVDATGYGHCRIRHWRARLNEELENDASPPATEYMQRTRDDPQYSTRVPSMAARIRALLMDQEGLSEESLANEGDESEETREMIMKLLVSISMEYASINGVGSDQRHAGYDETDTDPAPKAKHFAQ